jgi:chemotaxis regulatin CheY-phosphate phosphatase CheZ
MATSDFYIGPGDLNYVAEKYSVVLERAVTLVNKEQPQMNARDKEVYANQLAAQWHARMMRKQESARKKRLGS